MSAAAHKLPPLLKIACYDYRVIPMDAPWCEENNTRGTFEPREQELRVASDLASDAQTAETSLHEILHAIWDAYCIQPKDGEERIVTMTAVGLTQVFRDNPALLAWLAAALA